MTKINALAVLALNEEIKNGFQGDEMNLLQSIGAEYEVDAMDLVNAYNQLYLLNDAEKTYAWSKTEDQALLSLVGDLSLAMGKMQAYELFGTLVDREASAVQQRYSKLTRDLKKQEEQKALEMQQKEAEKLQSEEQKEAKEIQVVQNVHIEEESQHIEHGIPTASKAPRLIESLTTMLDGLEEQGEDVDNFFHIISQALGVALDKKKNGTNEEKSYRLENRELKQQVSDLEFQVEELNRVVKVLQKQLETEKEVSNSLRGEIWNLNSMKDSDKIRQLSKLEYVVGSDGVVNKKSKTM